MTVTLAPASFASAKPLSIAICAKGDPSVGMRMCLHMAFPLSQQRTHQVADLPQRLKNSATRTELCQSADREIMHLHGNLQIDPYQAIKLISQVGYQSLRNRMLALQPVMTAIRTHNMPYASGV